MLDVTDRLIIIIGGGAVAARKANGLIRAGASRVFAIAPEFRASFDPSVQQRLKCYEAKDLKAADLVFASTDSSAVNDQVVCDAKALGIWVNRADGSDDLPGDFSTPAKFESGAVTVMVSAGSPALASTIRDSLLARFDPAWSAMADAMKVLRPIIKSGELNESARANLFRTLATPEAIEVLREQGMDGLKNWIACRYEINRA